MSGNLPCLLISDWSTLCKHVTPRHLCFTALFDTLLLQNQLKSLSHIFEAFELVVGNILFLTVSDQTPFRKHNIRIADGTTIRDSVSDVHNDVVVRRECQHVIPLAVATKQTLSIRMRKRRYKFGHGAGTYELQMIRKEREIAQTQEEYPEPGKARRTL
jgi:hypothetical protein